MNYFHYFRDETARVLAGLAATGKVPAGLDLARAGFEPPRDPAHGDVATNLALVLAKPAGMKPRDLATLVAGALSAHPDIADVDVAGPGFINLRLCNGFWLARLGEILKAGKTYGESTLGAGRRVNIEFVSTNPTGPLHVGHARGAVVGDALASLLITTGYDVTREYYINDAGGQIDALVDSVWLRYREALGEDIGEIPEGLYPGEYLREVGAALVAADGNVHRGALSDNGRDRIREFAVGFLMDRIRTDLDALGVHMDVYTSERVVVAAGGVDRALGLLDQAGHIYNGVLEPPKGMKPEDWEPREQTLFRSTAFGDDVDRPVRKSDGSWTYFAADIANHLDKYDRGFREMIDVWGADHGGYVKRMQAAVSAVTDGEAGLDVKLCQMVNLMRDGVPVRMSKRAGAFTTLREVVDQVGRDVVRFIMLTRKNDATLDFDLVRVTEQSRENPVWYVQYAHARTRSLVRQAAELAPGLDTGDAALAGAPLERLGAPAEIALIRQLALWPAVVEGAALAHEPHRLAYYLTDLAAGFHGFWNRGREDPALRFIVDDPDLSAARLALSRAVGHVIASGLGIFGVTPLEELR